MFAPLRIHNPLDDSVPHLDAEDLHTDFDGLTDALFKDMQSRDITWLIKYYPEFTFEIVPKKSSAEFLKNFEFRAARPNGWIVANWRH